MRLGPQAMEALRAEVTGQLTEGDRLAVAGAAGLEGTELLVEREFEGLREYFSENFLLEAGRMRKLYGAEDSDMFCAASCMHRGGQGGILASLWKMAEVSQVGLHIDLRSVPIRQETIEICERFDLDPYKMLSGGCVLLGGKNVEEIVENCRESGIPAAVIGSVRSGNDRLLYSGEIVRYLDRPSADEILKMPWGHEVILEKQEK